MSELRETEVEVQESSIYQRMLALAFVIGLYYAIQLLTQLLAVYPHLGLPEDLTRHGSWVQVFDHHVWQMLLALAAIGILSRGRWREWGLNLRNRNESLRLIWQFLRYYGLYFIGIGFVVQWLFFPIPEVDHPLTVTHIAGRLLFGFLFVGLSEEILFRGLIQTYLSRFWRGVRRWGSIEMPVAGILAAGIFTLVHINFSIVPLQITHLYIPQLIMALVLGLFYAFAYHRTGSLLAPIVTHNLSDGLLWMSEYLLVWVG
jgi:uncharacterized protein